MSQMIPMELVLTASTVVAATAMVSSYLNYLGQTHRRRTAELSAARAAMIVHYEAVEKLTDDPAVSDELKLLLLTAAEGISNRNVARILARELSNGTLFTQHKDTPEKREVQHQIATLKRTRADLVEPLDTLAKSGLVAMFLRWPETAAVFTRFVAETVDARRETVAFERASQVTIRLARDRGNHDDTNMPSGFAPAAC